MDEQLNKLTDNWVSIGEVSKQTGISVFNLRMWERRYGAPASIKLPSGHRRYSPEEIAKLKLVKTAMSLKLKASKLVFLTIPELKKIISENEKLNPQELTLRNKTNETISNIYSWSDQLILQQFETDWQNLGLVDFVDIRIAHLLEKVGSCWETGDLSVASEHFVSSLLEAFLQSKWRKANYINSGAKIVLATLEGEHHAFGLQMAASVITAMHHNVIYLGASATSESVIIAAKETQAAAVLISTSQYFDSKTAQNELEYLRANLPDNIYLLTGGKGTPERISHFKNTERFSNFRTFKNWIIDHLDSESELLQKKPHKKGKSHA